MTSDDSEAFPKPQPVELAEDSSGKLLTLDYATPVSKQTFGKILRVAWQVILCIGMFIGLVTMAINVIGLASSVVETPENRVRIFTGAAAGFAIGVAFFSVCLRLIRR